jgi:hypothetical protein
MGEKPAVRNENRRKGAAATGIMMIMVVDNV